MTTADIEAHIREIYGISMSDTTISRVTDKILPVVREWQQRPLASVYAVVFMDAIHFYVCSEGQIVKKAVYIAIGVQMDGIRDVLGMVGKVNEFTRRERECQVLVGHPQRPWEPRRPGYLDCACRWLNRVSECD